MEQRLADEIKEALQNNLHDSAVAKIQKYLKENANIPLNIAITGEAGSGKSTFVNAFRGVEDDDEERAAPTGCVETTMKVTAYPHPNYPNVTLWDLPGVGTTNFPAAKYLEHVGFEKFDFFIIISAVRFTENDVMLAQEIQKMGRKFYFVHSKIDNDLDNEKKRKKRTFNAEATIARVRQDCIQRLENLGATSPKVFLVSSFELQKHDFSLLHETLERELPEHKRDALLYAMPNISLEIINRKKEALQSKIKYYAILSAAVKAVPVPGLADRIDVAVLLGVVKQYVVEFGLDIPSLQRLSDSADVPFRDLKAVIISPLAATEVTPDLIKRELSQCANTAALVAAEEMSCYIPSYGIPAAMAVSLITVYRALNTVLDMLAGDAQRVFRKALGLKPSE